MTDDGFSSHWPKDWEARFAARYVRTDRGGWTPIHGPSVRRAIERRALGTDSRETILALERQLNNGAQLSQPKSIP